MKSMIEIGIVIITACLFQIVQSKTFTVFNACPSTSVYMKFGSTASVDASTTSILYTGYSSLNTVTYSPVYYQILDESNNVLVTSSFTITNGNQNGIGYVLYPTGVCQNFQYAPTDPSLSSRSVVVYVNGGQRDKSVSVGNNYQGRVYAKPDSYLQITSDSTIAYTDTYVGFCNETCAYSYRGGANIPKGSAIFFINYYYDISSTTTYVVAAVTGSTTVSLWCENDACDYDLDLDDFGPPPITGGTIAWIVIGAVGGCCILCGLGYLIYRFCSKKKDFADSTLPLNNSNL
jgi:hypothetical protein